MSPRPSLREVHRALFGGRGTVSVQAVAHPLPAGFEVALDCRLSAGGAVGTHVQEACDEVVIGIAGAGAATVDGERVRLAPGTVVAVALGQTLALENRSRTRPLRYLIVKAAPRGSGRKPEVFLP